MVKEKPVKEIKPEEEKLVCAPKKMIDDDCDDRDDDYECVKTKMADLEKKVEEYQKEIAQLKDFKEKTLKDKKDAIVPETLSKVKEFLDEETYKKISDDGESCSYENIENWKDKTLAVITEKALSKINQLSSKEYGILDMGMPVTTKTYDSIYD